MLIRSASPVIVKPELPGVAGEKLTVLTAASGDEVASWDEQARHGMFTHHLLDALYGKGDLNDDGRVTAAEAKLYLDDTMTIAARVEFGRYQNASLDGVTDVVLARAGTGDAFPSRPSLDKAADPIEAVKKEVEKETRDESAVARDMFLLRERDDAAYARHPPQPVVHGNVYEWVQDCWHDSYRGAPSDGSAWTTGGDCGLRVLRGGSWYDEPKFLASAYRIRNFAGVRSNLVGFRVARTLD